MEKKFTQAKLIWTVTKAGMERIGADEIAKTISQFHLDAVRAIYSQDIKEQMTALRKKINHELRLQGNTNPEGYVPFLFSFVSRRAILSIPNKELEVTDGLNLKIKLIIDPHTCASNLVIDSSDAIEIRVSHEGQIKSLKEGSLLSFSYGAVEAKVTNLSPGPSPNLYFLNCQVELGGVLLSGMDVNSQDMSSDLFPLLPEDEKTLADKDFIMLADYVIVDGITSTDEFFYIKKAILGDDTKTSKRHPSVPITDKVLEQEGDLPPRFLLKVDSSRALELLPNLMPYIDGVFLSRSELGLDEHPHNLAILQKELIAHCNKMSKTIIVASELMHSMRKNANPTRAEVLDMANADADGADALVLSYEVTEGPHAHLVAQVSRETIINSEAWYEKKWRPFLMENIPSDDDAVTYGAIHIAEQAKVKAIVCFTEGGYTAMKLSAMRTPIQIIALTCNKKIMRQMSLLRSVSCILLDSAFQMEKILQEAKDALVKNFNFKKGEKFVFVSLTASSVAQRNSNLFTLQEID